MGPRYSLPRAGYPLLVAGAALLAAALALAGACWAGPGERHADPDHAALHAGVSNFGPQNATGVAELITSEGEVRLTAAGLQKPADTEEYQVWISSDETNERLRLGAVQVNDGGVGRLDTVLRQPIPEKPWNLMVLSVEGKGSQPARAERQALDCRPLLDERPRAAAKHHGCSQTPAATTPTTGTPTTGLLGLSSGGTILLVLLVVGVIGFALGRVGTRRGA